MTFFSSHARDQKRGQKDSAGNMLLPRLYVIGSQSSEHEEAEWALEIEAQQPSEKQVSLTTTSTKHKSDGRQEKHGLFSVHKTKKSEDVDRTATTSSSSPPKEEALPKIESTFFSLQNNTFGRRSTMLPLHNPVIKISIPFSPDYRDNSPRTAPSSDLMSEIEESLQAPDSTIGADEYLKFALASLQRQQRSTSVILPSTQQGFDVDKFVYFATSTLQYRHSRFSSHTENEEDKPSSPSKIPEQYVSQDQIEACRGAEGTVQQIDYAKFLKENAELRRQMEQGTKGKYLNLDNYPELRAQYSEGDTREEKRDKKKFGGFWISYGPSSGGTQSAYNYNEETVRTQPNPYGGLM